MTWDKNEYQESTGNSVPSQILRFVCCYDIHYTWIFKKHKMFLFVEILPYSVYFYISHENGPIVSQNRYSNLSINHTLVVPFQPGNLDLPKPANTKISIDNGVVLQEIHQ